MKTNITPSHFFSEPFTMVLRNKTERRKADMEEDKQIVYSTLFFIPEKKSELRINTNFAIEFEKPMPNWWHRFWQKVLLGWEWRSLK